MPLVPRAPALLVLAAAALLAGCGEREPAARNLLFVSIDTLRADALGSYGSDRGASPFLDELAREGTRFARAWSNSPKTAPSHMTMLTGLPPRVHGVGNLDTAGADRLGPDARTLAEILSARGWATAAFTAGGNVKAVLGFDRGFDVYDDDGGAWSTDADEIRAWLEQRTPEQPWFLFAHTYDVHDPYLPPPQVAERFTDPAYAGAIVGDALELHRLMQSGENLAQKDARHRALLMNFWRRADLEDPADLAYMHSLYLACLAHLDAQLRELFAWMEERGLLEDTLVIVTSDHGEEFGEHGRVLHDQLWREILHVPLIVRAPRGLGAGVAIDADVRHVDLVPSVLELLDVADPAGERTGESWAPWLADPARAAPRPAYSEHRSRRELPLDLWTLRADGWLLHEDRERRTLHRLAEDPLEQAPLDDPAQEQRMLDQQRHHLGALQRLAERLGIGEGIELSAEMRAELEALGYL